jgi:hypothetical protein
MGSMVGQRSFGDTLEAKKYEIPNQFPTGFRLAQSFDNDAAIDAKALKDLARKSNRTRAEEEILILAQMEAEVSEIADLARLPAELFSVGTEIRRRAMSMVNDRRFVELYNRFFAGTYGPIRRAVGH